jgi:hypothetical protein
MDIPTIVIGILSIATIFTAIFLYTSKIDASRASKFLCIFSLVTFFTSVVLGEFLLSWGGNATCSKFLGCVEGFAGYDAFEHLLFGMTAVWTSVYISYRFPKLSILSKGRYKKILMLLAFVALVAVFWELIECAHDYFRLDILHEPILSFRFHRNLLDQPTNLDTMGDIAFALFGGLFASIAHKNAQNPAP